MFVTTGLDNGYSQSIVRRMPDMEALIAAGAFLGLFSLWVLVPKVFIKK